MNLRDVLRDIVLNIPVHNIPREYITRITVRRTVGTKIIEGEGIDAYLSKRRRGHATYTIQSEELAWTIRKAVQQVYAEAGLL